MSNLKNKLKIKYPQVDYDQDQVVVDDDDEIEEGEFRREEEDQKAAGSSSETVIDDNNNNNNNTKVIIVNNSDNNQDQEEEIKGGGFKICPHCGREFINGKALGGHMRTHTEPNNKPSRKPNSGSPSPSSPSGDHREQQWMKCDLCPKLFRSQKSLFGHMRAHPERQWRGMQPPPELSGSGFRDQDPDLGRVGVEVEVEVEGLNSAAMERLSYKSLRWLRKGTRGQLAVVRLGDEVTAAYDLMMLSKTVQSPAQSRSLIEDFGDHEVDIDNDNEEYGASAMNNNKNKKMRRFFDEDERYFEGLLNSDYANYNDKCSTEKEVKKFKDEDKDEDYGDDEGKRVNGYVAGRVWEPSPAPPPAPTPTPTSSKKVSKNGNGKRVRDMSNVEDGGVVGGETTSKWKCSTCNRTFDSPQALGGHRSSHNKEKNNNGANNNNNNNTNTHIHIHIHSDTHIGIGGVDGSGVTGFGPGNSSNGEGDAIQGDQIMVHKCNKCDKTFTSGQALGGHQRCHYLQSSTADVSSSSSPVQSSCHTGRRENFFDLDLNVAITMEEEELEDGTAQSTLKL